VQNDRNLYISLVVNAEARDLIQALGLCPLPHEGGYFRRTWTGPAGPDGRPTGTAILFLVTAEGFSALHRLKTDEIWFHHGGDPAELTFLGPEPGAGRTLLVGPPSAPGASVHAVAAGGAWQGARLAPGHVHGWALFSCTMAPGWVDDEFELGNRATLEALFPRFAANIRALTR
jgi:uncharacterized protein